MPAPAVFSMNMTSIWLLQRKFGAQRRITCTWALLP